MGIKKVGTVDTDTFSGLPEYSIRDFFVKRLNS